MTGSNQTAVDAISLPKNSRAMTCGASPNQLPNIVPQNTVEIPQYKNILTVFFILGSSLSLALAMSMAMTIITP